jgi:hypothetical protein
MPEQARENDAIAGGRSSPSAQGDQYSGNQNNNSPSTSLLNARRIREDVIAQDKAEAAKVAQVKAAPVEAKKSSNVFDGVGDWFSNIFGDTSNDTEEEKSDPVGQGLKFLASPFTSVLGSIFKEGQLGMNDEAKAQYDFLEKEARGYSGAAWNTMTEAEKAHLARQPQKDKQLPHGFIHDGITSTANEDQLDAIRPFIKDLNMSDAQWNGLPIEMKRHLASNTKVNSGSGVITGGGGGNGGGGQNLVEPASIVPNWWEEGYVGPVVNQGVNPGVQPGQTPVFGGAAGGQQVPGLPSYLQNELAPTPDFTGSYQSSLLGNTALPSQQITGLLAPRQQQPQQYNFTSPQQQPQITLEQLQGLLGGSNGFTG